MLERDDTGKPVTEIDPDALTSLGGVSPGASDGPTWIGAIGGWHCYSPRTGL